MYSMSFDIPSEDTLHSLMFLRALFFGGVFTSQWTPVINPVKKIILTGPDAGFLGGIKRQFQYRGIGILNITNP